MLSPAKESLTLSSISTAEVATSPSPRNNNGSFQSPQVPAKRPLPNDSPPTTTPTPKKKLTQASLLSDSLDFSMTFEPKSPPQKPQKRINYIVSLVKDSIEPPIIVSSPKPARTSRTVGSYRNQCLNVYIDWEKIKTGAKYHHHPKQAKADDDNNNNNKKPQSPSKSDLKITNILNADQSAAEQVLDRCIHKSDFTRMQILGQFNLGFILVKLDKTNDLYIIDQHASDEKYNFEMLQAKAIISSQPVISTMPLEMSVTDESVALDNLDLLAKNGFILKVNQDAQPGRRLELRSQPFIDHVLFTSSGK